ncbi:MAG: hypothetical protein WKF92_12165 [Pyrinomonadaceae bacterium]
MIYKGPWKKVVDDDGHVLERGQRMAVCDKTFQIYGKAPYADHIIAIEPIESIDLRMLRNLTANEPQNDIRENRKAWNTTSRICPGLNAANRGVTVVSKIVVG